jgi:hypothetical protein
MKKDKIVMLVVILCFFSFSLVYHLVSKSRNASEKPVCIGDINADGNVNMDDLVLLSSKFGTKCKNCPEDLNGDKVVDTLDNNILLKHYKNGCDSIVASLKKTN